MGFKNIIWDWNGTIIDDAWVFADIMNNVLQKHYNTKTILCSFEDKLQFMNLKKERFS